MIKPSHDFSSIDYLKNGNVRQRSAFEVLHDLKIITTLASFKPLLVGTIPIEIDLPASDLDIICEFHDAVTFREFLIEKYGQYENFDVRHKVVERTERVVANFNYRGWMFEIFGQPIPTTQQNGYRHMIIEDRILNLLGSKAKRSIIQIKGSGLKTEPAFGKMLKLKGDPYSALLEMYEWNTEQLEGYLRANSADVV
ncbi:HIT family protein [Saccharibacillus sp. O16]|nr:HIT family protein [Saccharibacillus sp. O16]